MLENDIKAIVRTKTPTVDTLNFRIDYTRDDEKEVLLQQLSRQVNYLPYNNFR